MMRFHDGLVRARQAGLLGERDEHRIVDELVRREPRALRRRAGLTLIGWGLHLVGQPHIAEAREAA